MNTNEKQIDILVLEAQNGCSDSFGELYDQFLDPIYRYIYLRVSSVEVAEDLAGEVFFKALKSLKKYKKRKNLPFSAWLFRIAKNILIDHYRKHVALDEIPETIPDESSDADSKKKTNIGIEKKRILTAIQELPEMQSQAIALKYFSELKNQEIAQVLEKSETAVRILSIARTQEAS